MAGQHIANIGVPLNWCCQTDPIAGSSAVPSSAETPSAALKGYYLQRKGIFFASSYLLHCTSTNNIVVLIQKCPNLTVVPPCGSFTDSSVGIKTEWLFKIKLEQLAFGLIRGLSCVLNDLHPPIRTPDIRSKFYMHSSECWISMFQCYLKAFM